MFKNIIAPMQAWLLSQKRCVGCGLPLTQGKVLKRTKEEHTVSCEKCSRIYLYNLQTKRYKRAPINVKT
ncbi:hypothetical protein COV53_04105 [Candidatus Gottesmanbacteria bacterium CG11_big_fil_rev_8_21_14_0_20_37_11]|uniref:Uncharacterized protein n=2 Tax=Candidatus Gottesmaniibacteriota TaxID=1752720 RepID=A0A1J4TV93_9BACT|nr:MAG: hypothetical protein AUJ73_01500 [Candidatus Gottesmanbacteria bacterium CG1_02_37_22]PIR08255.1 MAG: hypothetical protein COV53_04105 [Candidatus Gottesmanbacteria bacterium CG11_big_fil_rev_8_21_14_0_20_37_11]